MITSRIGKRQKQNLAVYSKLAVKSIFFILFIATLFFLVSQFKSHFPIKSVQVFGIKHVDQGSLQEELTPLVSKGFFAIDVETIKDRLLQSPWVSSVIVQRVWPDTVRITVVEKTPMARWNDSSLVSNTGEIFTPNQKSIPEGLPQFIGPEGQHMEMLQSYKKLSGILMPLHFKIARLELTPEHSWNLMFENGMKMSMGYKDVLTRMSHFVKVYPKIIGDRAADVEYVDLRYPNGLAVRWKTVI